MKTAVIFGVTGQDGSYLSELLLAKNYNVVGVYRRSSVDTTIRLEDCKPSDNFTLVYGDVVDSGSIFSILNDHKPDEVYNLAAQSHVGTSFLQPKLTWDVTGQGCLNILEAIRTLKLDARFYQASSSEMFGNNFSEDEDGHKYQDERTPFSPQSPYAIAKCAAHYSVSLYRQSYNIFACGGILFNHESERRGERFVTRKISRYIATLRLHEKLGTEPPKLYLGNLDACRDWGHAEDYVKAMWLMLQQEVPEDYVIATGNSYSVRDFLDEAFSHYPPISNWEDCVRIHPSFLRPSDVPYLRGIPDKAKEDLGWSREVSFEELVKRMVESDTAQMLKGI
jgi:GDPmannose 4,6-dehydratase